MSPPPSSSSYSTPSRITSHLYLKTLAILQMDKLLAMSILSAGPDSSLGDWWLSYLPSGDHLKKKKKEAKNEKEMCSGASGGSKDSNSKYSSGKVEKPRFAMEFDGLHCFETIVSH